MCIATGPSLTQADVDLVKGKAKVIAINDSYKLAPWADVLYACDARWWKWHKGVTSFTGPKYGVDRSLLKHSRKEWGVTVLRHTGPSGLETDRTGLRTGKNSGYQAINLARHLGAKRILLLGYDMKRGEGGKEHFFGHHPNNSRSPYHEFLRRFQSLEEPLRNEGIEVINCTRSTALKVWPLMPLEQALK